MQAILAERLKTLSHLTNKVQGSPAGQRVCLVGYCVTREGVAEASRWGEA